jgi:HPt (histidine-containing phosphotransfer) domain-containing protein
MASMTDGAHTVLDDAAIERLTRIGGATLVVQMIRLFLEHGPQRLAQTDAGQSTHDLRAIEHGAHSLKSSAGNLGAVRLQHAAAAVEQATESADDVDMDALIKALHAEYDAAAVALQAKLTELE